MTEVSTPAIHTDPNHARIHGVEIARIGFVLVAAAGVWFQLWEPFERLTGIGLVASLIGGYPIYREAWGSTLAACRTNAGRLL